MLDPSLLASTGTASKFAFASKFACVSKLAYVSKSACVSASGRVATLAFAAMLAAACGEAPAPRGFSVDTLDAGRFIATNTGTGAWSDDDRWTARVGVSIGRTEGTGPDVFSRVSALHVDERSRIFVLDYASQEVRVFDASGAHLRTIGRKGEGPGELWGASAVATDDAGNVWVRDLSDVTVFDSTGALVSTTRSRGLGWLGDFDDTGGLFTWGISFPEQVDSETGGLIVMHPVIVDLGVGTSDTFPAIEYRRTAIEGGFVAGPYHDLQVHRSVSGDLWFGGSHEYRLHRRTLEGDTILTIVLADAAPEPIPDEEIDELLNDLREHAQRRSVQRDVIGTTRPVLERITSDDAGHLFVFAHLDNHAAGTFVDVFREESGEYLGRVELPLPLLSSPRPVARDGALYGLTTTELDVPIIVRFDIGPPR